MFQTFVFPGDKPLNVHVFRLDVNHPLISGNKFYKLRPWLEKAQKQQAGLLSCGGAWSNHLHALAAAGQQADIAVFGLVRGLEQDNLTVTLEDCIDMGMQLIPITRTAYQNRYQPDFAVQYQQQLGMKTLWVPEGGTDENAVSACEYIGLEINRCQEKHRFDSVWLSVGSGGTLAGIARSLDTSLPLYAVPVLKHWDDVRYRVNSYLKPEQAERINWIGEGNFGGFGRCNQRQINFHAKLEHLSGIPFDPVYTSKLVRRMLEIQTQGNMPGENPLVIHTGGLQGRRSIENELNGISF